MDPDCGICAVRGLTKSRGVRMLMARNAGFTFVEIHIVAAIIGILAAIAIPAYNDYIIRSEVSEALIFLGDAKTSVNDFRSRWGRMPASNEEAGLRAPEELRGQVLDRFEIIDGTLVASMVVGRKRLREPLERTLTFRPWINTRVSGSPIIWSCGIADPGLTPDYATSGEVAANPLEDKYLPSNCRQ